MYSPISIPLQTPQVVRDVIEGSVEPFMRDVHAMLQLPADGTLPHIGCNLSIAQVLLASVAGVSAVLYSTEGYSGSVFRSFVTDFFPWDAEPKSNNAIIGAEAARILYDDYRNPLTHAAGQPVFSTDNGARRKFIPQPYRLQINRVAFDSRPGRGLATDRLLELESEPTRPPWLPATLKLVKDLRVLTVESLYWDFRVSVQRLCADTARMDAAIKLFTPARVG